MLQNLQMLWKYLACALKPGISPNQANRFELPAISNDHALPGQVLKDSQQGSLGLFGPFEALDIESGRIEFRERQR